MSNKLQNKEEKKAPQPQMKNPNPAQKPAAPTAQKPGQPVPQPKKK